MGSKRSSNDDRSEEATKKDKKEDDATLKERLATLKAAHEAMQRHKTKKK